MEYFICKEVIEKYKSVYNQKLIDTDILLSLGNHQNTQTDILLKKFNEPAHHYFNSGQA